LSAAIALHYSDITNRHIIGPEELKSLFEWRALAKEITEQVVALKNELFEKDEKIKRISFRTDR